METFMRISRDGDYCMYGFSSWHGRRADSEPAYQYLKHHLPDETEWRRKSSFLFSRVFYTGGVNVYEPSPRMAFEQFTNQVLSANRYPHPTGVFTTRVEEFAGQPCDIPSHGILT